MNTEEEETLPPKTAKDCIWCDESISVKASVCKVCGKNQNRIISTLSSWHVFELLTIALTAIGALTAIYQANEAREALHTANVVKKETVDLNLKLEETKKFTESSIVASQGNIKKLSETLSSAEDRANTVVSDLEKSKSELASVREELSQTRKLVGGSMKEIFSSKISDLEVMFSLHQLSCKKTVVEESEMWLGVGDCINTKVKLVTSALAAHSTVSSLPADQAELAGIDKERSVSIICTLVKPLNLEKRVASGVAFKNIFENEFTTEQLEAWKGALTAPAEFKTISPADMEKYGEGWAAATVPFGLVSSKTPEEFERLHAACTG